MELKTEEHILGQIDIRYVVCNIYCCNIELLNYQVAIGISSPEKMPLEIYRSFLKPDYNREDITGSPVVGVEDWSAEYNCIICGNKLMGGESEDLIKSLTRLGGIKAVCEYLINKYEYEVYKNV